MAAPGQSSELSQTGAMSADLAPAEDLRSDGQGASAAGPTTVASLRPQQGQEAVASDPAAPGLPATVIDRCQGCGQERSSAPGKRKMRYCLHCGKLFVPAAQQVIPVTVTGRLMQGQVPPLPATDGKDDEMPPWLKPAGIIALMFFVGAKAGGNSEWSWPGGLYAAAGTAFLLLAGRYPVVAFLGAPVCFYFGVRMVMEGIKIGEGGDYGAVAALFIFGYAILLLGVGGALLVGALRKSMD